MGFIKHLKEEIKVIRERDPAIHSSWEVLLYPSFKVMLHYRLAHKLYQKGHYFLARYISQKGVRRTGIEIHPGAQIGKGFFIDHGNGVIIGETTIIGDNVTLYQGVTLGGTGKEHGKRHPTIGNNVMISAGAKVLGSFTIGDNSKIGAGSVVLHEVPPNSTVVGVPGRVVRRNNMVLPQETLNQTDLPDPIREDIATLQKSNASLIERLIELEEELKVLKQEAALREAERMDAGTDAQSIRKCGVADGENTDCKVCFEIDTGCEGENCPKEEVCVNTQDILDEKARKQIEKFVKKQAKKQIKKEVKKEFKKQNEKESHIVQKETEV